jgi:hypothetical protein
MLSHRAAATEGLAQQPGAMCPVLGSRDTRLLPIDTAEVGWFYKRQ